MAGLEGSRVGEIVEQVVHYEGEAAVHDVISGYICSFQTLLVTNTAVVGSVSCLDTIRTEILENVRSSLDNHWNRSVSILA